MVPDAATDAIAMKHVSPIPARRAAAFAAVFAAATAGAALKYGPDAYVQKGLVVHLDGIRNAGADKPHDPAAAMWANLANGASPARIKKSASSGWTGGVGYRFNYDGGASYAQIAEATDATTQATFEIVVDASLASQSLQSWGCYFVTGTDAQGMCLIDKNLGFNANTWVSGTGNDNRPQIKDWGWKQASFTIGAAGADGLRAYDSGVLKASIARPAENEIPATQWMFGSRIGQNDKERNFTGIMKSARVYSRALSPEEVAANAAVDAARFDGVMPVTNAVVATSVEGVFASEVPGVYAVDGSHVFSAPASVTAGGKTWTPAGYTLEKWNGAGWDAPETVSAFSCTVGEDEKVRITWLWEEVAATLGAGIDAYATDSIKVWYDGICNVGKGLAHSSAATKWRQLATLSPANVTASSDSHWTDDGYRFTSGGSIKSYVYAPEYISLGPVGTIELACDVKAAEQTATWPRYVAFGQTQDGRNTDMSIHSYQKQTYLRMKPDDWSGGDKRANITDPWDGKHAAFVLDESTIRSYKAGARDNSAARGTNSKQMPAVYWMLGNMWNGSANNDQLVGTIKAVRAYGKVLTDAEIARHYAIDTWRFDGTIPARDAVEVAGISGAPAGREAPGVYFPLGGWTFKAARTVAGGVEWEPAGYVVETFDEATSTWSVTESSDSGASWTSPADAGFAARRLAWKWRPVSGIRRAADYAVSDYAQGGLRVWYDGICNDGIGAKHVSDASHAWRELVSGESATMASNANTGWAEDGYRFDVGPNKERSYVYLRKFVSLGSVGTIELACDLDPSVQKSDWNKMIHFGQTNGTWSAASDNGMCVQTYQKQTYVRLTDDNWTGNNETVWAGTQYANYNYRVNTKSGWDGKHAAFVVDETDHRAYVKGALETVAPRHAAKEMTPAFWMLGNSYYVGSEPGNQINGTMKAVRAYGRVLSDDEIAWNYKVDVARFDGALAVTNVVVEASDLNGGAAADAYEVFGSHEFVSPEANVVRVRTLQPDGSWGDVQFVPGRSWTYVVGESPATVSICFKKTEPLVVIFR